MMQDIKGTTTVATKDKTKWFLKAKNTSSIAFKLKIMLWNTSKATRHLKYS